MPCLRQSKISGLDSGAVPDASTINALVPCVDPLNQEARMSRDRSARLREWMCDCRCIYVGGEIGSTDVVKTKLRGRRASGLNRKKISNCK